MAYDAQSDRLHREATAAKSLLAELASDDDILNHDMVEGETFFEAIDMALAEIDDCEIIVAGCATKEAQISERREKAQRRKERLRTLIEQSMLIAELPTAKRPCATLTVSHIPPKAIIDDESVIPAEFWKQPDPVLDRTAINAAIKDGQTIPGVGMTNGTTSLRIRRV